MSEPGKRFEKLLDIISALRGGHGCPWDREQTPESVKRYIVEEAYEAVSEVEAGNINGVKEELGDLIFMTLFLGYLYQEKGLFSIEDALESAAKKMIYRHPHVFGNLKVQSAEQVKENWDRLKGEEKGKAGKVKQDIPRSLPALMRAHRLIGRAGLENLCGDFPEHLRQHLENLLDSTKSGSKHDTSVARDKKIKNDTGETLFLVACLARSLGVNAEDALQEVVERKLREISE